MNDATELQSSLNGAIDFFQNLHRKLGTLETETVTRHDQLQTLSTTLVTLQKDRQADQQTLAHLSSGVLKLQADSRVLEQQLNTVEGLATGFQQDQQRLQDTLSNVVNDLRTQDERWRQEFAQTLGQQAQTLQTQITALESQWAQHQERFGALEQTARAGHEQIEQVSTIIESQYKRLLKFDMALENFDQHSRSLNQTLGALKTDFERHEQTLKSLKQASGVDETARQQLQVQQDRLDRLTALATAAEQQGQIVQQDVAQLKSELDTQRGLLTDAVQVRQDVQKNQDRLKHLETLMTKVAGDTNSTRQILNVVQSDLTTQSDTLRELDQQWNDTLGNYQERLSRVEARLTGSMPPPVMLPEPATVADSSTSPVIDPERFEALEAALATACSQHNQGLMALERELSAIQITLDQQDAHVAEWQGALAEPLGAVQQRLGELESNLEGLRQSIEAGSATKLDADTVLDDLRQTLVEQSAALEETQQLAWSQIQDLQQRLSEAEATLDSAPPAVEPIAVANVDLDASLASVRSEVSGTLDELRQALAEQSAALEETQQLAWSQIQDLQQRLSEAEATLDSAPLVSEPIAVANVDLDASLAHVRSEMDATLASVRSEVDATLDELRQALAEQSAALAETQQLA
ncbi:MAG: hypothetical protein QG599_2200, partial [Pseudomonadota bacterium]|nr:hypothetical protein [Pseudomonadota bacterium]